MFLQKLKPGWAPEYERKVRGEEKLRNERNAMKAEGFYGGKEIERFNATEFGFFFFFEF